MGRSRTLSDLISDVRRTVDADGQDDNDGRHPRDFIVRSINQAAQRLQNLLVEGGNHSHLSTLSSNTAYAVQSVTPAASNIAQIVSVSASRTVGGLTDGKYWRLRRGTLTDYARWRSLDVLGPPEAWFPIRTGGSPLAWAIVVSPGPDAVYSIQYDYLHALVDLDADDDELDGIAGYEDYVVYDAAVRLCERDANADGRLPLLMAARDRAEADVRRFNMTREISAVHYWPEPRGPGGFR